MSDTERRWHAQWVAERTRAEKAEARGAELDLRVEVLVAAKRQAEARVAALEETLGYVTQDPCGNLGSGICADWCLLSRAVRAEARVRELEAEDDAQSDVVDATPSVGTVDTERHGWAVHHGRTVVECPGCAFTMGADHVSEGEDRPFYDCPNCGDASAVPQARRASEASPSTACDRCGAQDAALKNEGTFLFCRDRSSCDVRRRANHPRTEEVVAPVPGSEAVRLHGPRDRVNSVLDVIERAQRSSDASTRAYQCHGHAVPSGERCPECRAPTPLDGSRTNEAKRPKAKDCIKCDGSGRVSDEGICGDPIHVQCDRCHGSGKEAMPTGGTGA